MSYQPQCEKLVIFSLDYDGCADALFMDENHPHMNEHLNKTKNKLLDDLKNKSQNFSLQVEVYVGSNRQSQKLNLHNMLNNNNGCCFTNYAAMCKKRGWKFNPLLMADLQNNKSPGTAMNLVNNIPDKENAPFLDWNFNQDKNNIILAQLQDAAKNHPSKNISFYFYDDRPDILYWLKEYFTNHTNQIPRNITLVLTHNSRINWEKLKLEVIHKEIARFENSAI